MCKEFVMQGPGRQAGLSTGCNNKFHYNSHTRPAQNMQPRKEKAYFYMKDETMNIICEVLLTFTFSTLQARAVETTMMSTWQVFGILFCCYLAQLFAL